MTVTRTDPMQLYRATRAPALVEVPELAFLMIDGEGDPNGEPAFREAVEALFAISYTARFTLKRSGIVRPGTPLEALWWTPDEAPRSRPARPSWSWTAMLRQPDEVTAAVVEDACEAVTVRRGELPALARVRLEPFEEGLAAQILHIGPYSIEWPTIERLHAFIAVRGLRPSGRHHEIYLGDPRRAAPEKLRTILCQAVSAA